MTRLIDLLSDEFSSPEEQLALELAREDQGLLAELVAIRRRRMSQEQVAEILGLSQATISAFERIGNDPHQSTIRRYARAIGVMIRHHVDDDPANCGDSHFLTHVGDRGLNSQATATALARHLASQSTPAWPAATVAPRVQESVAS